LDSAIIKINRNTAAMIWCSVINAAWHEIHKGDFMEQYHAVSWVKSFRTRPGSFRWICCELGIHAGKLRQKMLTKRPELKYAPLHGKYIGM